MKVILDTSFLMSISIKPIKRFDILEDLECIVLSAVIEEIKALERSKSVKRSKAARAALEMIERMGIRIVDLKGSSIDKLIMEYADATNSYIATLDMEMKRRAKEMGIGIVTLYRDRIIIDKL